MLERKYDPTLPYRFAKYGRMSDPKQNKRSPDQQFVTIDETLGRCGYSWVCVATYRDDGISGQFIRKRAGLQRLMRDIEGGLIQVDLIVVDTMERLGRAEEIAGLRHRLFVNYGVLVVAADNGFCDPTGVVGKAVGMIEQVRSTENTRISRHNVLRGKRDAARRRRWPGGAAPFGFRLKPILDETSSPPDLYNVLEIDPCAADAQRLAFQRAAETGEGDQRMSRWWNTSADIPQEFKPISPYTMGYRLSNLISIGTLAWGVNRTGVVNDTRVIERNPDGPVVIADFCPALVDLELFERVQRQRRARSEQTMSTRGKAEPERAPKLIAPQGRGLTLKYLLTGLVRCPCKANLRPVPSGRQSKAGRRYLYYTCPRHYDGSCNNARYVPEGPLREAVIARLRARLFPAPAQHDQTPTWLPELVTMVGQELRRYRNDEPDRTAVIQEELRQLEERITGWSQSLGNPQLAAVVRIDIECRYAEAKQRQQDLMQTLAAEQALRRHLEQTLDAKEVIAQLHKLAEVLASSNVNLANLELSKHIAEIVCWPDGRVASRGTMLGLFDGAVDLLSRDNGMSTPVLSPATTGGFPLVKPRRRGRLQIPSLSADSIVTLANVDTILDPERFANLPGEFFWSDSFVLEEKLSWAQANAAEVVRLRVAGMTIAQLAAHCDKSIPTIRKVLSLGVAAQPQQLPKKIPRRRWCEDHAEEVMRWKQGGMSTAELAAKFGKCEKTIVTTLLHAVAIAASSCPLDAVDDADAARHAGDEV